MKRKNVKDEILRHLVSLDVPLVWRTELLEVIDFDNQTVEFGVLELERDKHLVVGLSDGKLTYQLTQNGEIFIQNTSYYDQYRKSQRSFRLQTADKLIAILGILCGIVFGVHSCSTDSQNDRLLDLIERKDSIISNFQSNSLSHHKLKITIDSLMTEINEIKAQIPEKVGKTNQ